MNQLNGSLIAYDVTFWEFPVKCTRNDLDLFFDDALFALSEPGVAEVFSLLHY